MAFLTCDFFSDALQVGTSMTVVMPQRTESQIGVDGTGAEGPPPVLYLLHGLSDDHTAWHRYTAIGRYAEAAGLAVVMPAVHRSFYTNEAHGHRYWDFVADELPGVVQEFFRVSDRREDTFVAGQSMGGYGALKLALTFPQRYAAAASLSGGLELELILGNPERSDLADRVFGGTRTDDQDVFDLLRQASGVPPLYLGCGTEDPLLGGTRRFHDEAVAAGLDVTLDLRPGTHEWSLWDDYLRDVIAWLPLAGRPGPENAERIG